jgi:hypothetical protein
MKTNTKVIIGLLIIATVLYFTKPNYANFNFWLSNEIIPEVTTGLPVLQSNEEFEPSEIEEKSSDRMVNKKPYYIFDIYEVKITIKTGTKWITGGLMQKSNENCLKDKYPDKTDWTFEEQITNFRNCERYNVYPETTYEYKSFKAIGIFNTFIEIK